MTKLIKNLSWCLALGWGILSSYSALAQQNYPDKPITLVVPYAPAGSADVFARILSQELGKELGQSIIVNNQAGAAGNVGAALVARSPSDGYTLLFGTAAIAIAPSVYKNLNYDAEKDLQAIALVGSSPALVLTTPAGPNTIDQLIAQVKAQPGVYSYAASGIGSATHIVAEYFNQKANIDAFAVPYKGAGPAKQGLMSDLHLYTFETASSAISLVKSGKLKAIALATDQRSPLLPNVPTIAESGIQGVSAGTWNMVFAPEKTPKFIIDKLNVAINKVLSNPIVAKKLHELVIDINASSTPMSAEAYLKSETLRWKELVSFSKVKTN
ncbi:tripartite tricarboxylate transporter substrate-binding protein [Polynucleobacter sp. UK-Mo-2m-Kol15]|uniref:tripartite tricarboxylate transporter substrate-binding protein n=1 Tax=Polynucleobacter sp. UK-Mo-2m-Kol15 TaxID=2576916 RepID=UPI001C0ACFF5|nr:tripartite tricarboxylate transporter substrate-binding protein [Polynucleobacter sp. UK-Mo-2m-Kol15]MBU3575750.1 tripartite tricarboxylate transporter substrate binding protein [Polynucleobacter sp. UK-Mo-2m-Kol15]